MKEKFCWTNFNKIRRFLLYFNFNKIRRFLLKVFYFFTFTLLLLAWFSTNCTKKKSTPKYRWKFEYRPIFKRSNIGRYYRWTDISVGLYSGFYFLCRKIKI